MPLTDIQIRQAKPKLNPYKITDSHGLYLHVYPSGKKTWRWNYRFEGRQKTLTFGDYPRISLSDVRAEHAKQRDILLHPDHPRDPAEVKRIDKAGKPTFENVAREWFALQSKSWAQSHSRTVLGRMTKNMFPYLGKRMIDKIEPPELLRVLRRIEDRGHVETAHRCKTIAGQVFRYGISTGRCDRDPSADLRGALTPVNKQHFPMLVSADKLSDLPGKVGELLRAIDDYSGQYTTLCALRLAPHVFLRPGELRQAQWHEIDTDNQVWTIPSERMKARRVHAVPLSRQAVGIIESIRPLTGRWDYVFPGIRSRERPISDNTLNGALRRLGYEKTEFVAHSFRAIASTLLHELNWHHDLIELQLAHRIGSQVSQAYNHSERLPERSKMMQAWSDYLDSLKRGGTVIPIRKTG